jgi:hypothetical protein
VSGLGRLSPSVIAVAYGVFTGCFNYDGETLTPGITMVTEVLSNPSIHYIGDSGVHSPSVHYIDVSGGSYL